MSTTDTREAFEAWALERGFNLNFGPDGENYLSGYTQGVWEPWQAATEAAKATGTAGELSDEEILKIQEKHIPKHGWSTNGLLFARDVLAAARQPAPVADNDAFKEAYMEWIRKTDWVQEQISSFPPSALGMHRADVMREEIERLRAALAATSAPVLSDERICELADPYLADHAGYWKGHFKTTEAIAFARAILAATTTYRR